MADLIRSEKPLAVSPIKTGQPLGAILALRPDGAGEGQTKLAGEGDDALVASVGVLPLLIDIEMADLIRSEKPLAVSPIKTGQPLGAILASLGLAQACVCGQTGLARVRQSWRARVMMPW
jgi:predicted N-acetyltransferase YhbS